jgi:hypothetical protein
MNKLLTIPLIGVLIFTLGITTLIPFPAQAASFVVDTVEATNITGNAATLNGNLSDLGTDTPVDLYFELGLTTEYTDNFTVGPKTETGTFSHDSDGLKSGTTYHFRAKAVGATQGTVYGADMEFFTTPIAPQITTNDTTSIGLTAATIHGSLLDLGTAPDVKVYFEYGTTTAYVSTTTFQNMNANGPISANLSGLLPNTTYHLRAVADGGIHGVAFGADVNFTTLSPPSVTTYDASNITFDGATLNGNLVSPGTAQTISVFFEYGPTSIYGSSTAPQSIAVFGPRPFSVILGGLNSSTIYHFRACADGGTSGTATSPDMTFTTMTPPQVSTLPVSAITANTAILSGALTSLGTAGTVEVYFEYGLTTAYGATTTSQAFSNTTIFTSSLSGLSYGAVYHFRARANGGLHGVSTGPDMLFSLSSIPPAVSTSPATSITTSRSALNGNLAYLGTAEKVDVFFEYGFSSAYGNKTEKHRMLATGPFSFNIFDLLPSTTYHFRFNADAGANGYASGTDMTFTTDNITAPNVVTGAASLLTANSATVNGNLSVLGTAGTVDVFFEYGTTNSFGSTTPVQKMNSVGSFNFKFSGLSPSATYHFRAVADAGAHGKSYGIEMTFTTKSDNSGVIIPVVPTSTVKPPVTEVKPTPPSNSNLTPGSTTAAATSTRKPTPTVLPVKKSDNILLVSIIAAVAVLLIGGIAYLVIKRKRKSFTAVAPPPVVKRNAKLVKLVIKAPADSSQISAFEEQLRQSPYLSVESIGGSAEEGNVIVVSQNEQMSAYLADVIKLMPPVKAVVQESKWMVVELSPALWR